MFGFLKRHSSEKYEEKNRNFKEKYRQFRELLDRNHEVLETITELSEIKEKRVWISLVRIRSKITKAAVNKCTILILTFKMRCFFEQLRYTTGVNGYLLPLDEIQSAK